MPIHSEASFTSAEAAINHVGGSGIFNTEYSAGQQSSIASGGHKAYNVAFDPNARFNSCGGAARSHGYHLIHAVWLGFGAVAVLAGLHRLVGFIALFEVLASVAVDKHQLPVGAVVAQNTGHRAVALGQEFVLNDAYALLRTSSWLPLSSII